MAQDFTALDESTRLASFRSYEVLDTPPEPAFNRLAKLAAQIYGALYVVIGAEIGAIPCFLITRAV